MHYHVSPSSDASLCVGVDRYETQTEHDLVCRGSDFYHAHHTRRIGVERSLSLTYVESVVVRAASLFGGVEVAGRKMVAGARKKYAELPLGITQVVERALSLPGNVYPAVKLHVIKYFSALYHLAMRWFALNVVAHLYTKRVQ